MKKNIHYLFSYSIMGALVLFQMFSTLLNATTGLTYRAEYNALEKEKLALQQEIGKLQIELSGKSAIASLESFGESNGYISISELQYITGSDTLASAEYR